jgi:acetolactate synthase-1/2/3 large subunit
MAEIQGGHVVARYLKEVAGIETVFSLAGGHIMPVLDGCLEYGVKNVDVRHEQAAVMMAHAWSIYKHRPGVCLVTAGPGFTNALTGVANAYLENAPVVVLSGMVAVRDLDKGALQDLNQVDMVKPVVKWTGRCYDIERITEYLEKAFKYAVSGRPGPVFLEIPPDVLYATMEEDEVQYPAHETEGYPVAPDGAAIKKAVDLIDNAEKPVLMGGSGVAASNCGEELRAFVEKTGIPTILLNNGRGAIPDEHPLSLWDGGLMGMLAAFSMADVVLSIGIRYNWVLGYGQPLANAKVIRVDIDPLEINRNRKADVGLVGDAGAVLRLLDGGVQKADHTGWLKSLKGVFDSLTAAEKKQRETPSDPIHPFRLMHQLRQATGDDAIFVVDGGDTVYFAHVGLRAKEMSGVIGSGLLFSCLGTGVPFGIGAALARPDKRVILVTGDGSFGLNAMEFDTAVRHCLPLVCVICNDQAWGMVKHSQEIRYCEDRVCGTELGVVHYERIVEALGGHGEFVEKDDEIVPAVRRALDSGKPACVNVVTDPSAVSPATLMFAEGFKF